MKQKIVCVAGFGDDGSMFEALQNTSLALEYTIVPYCLPGFGAPPLNEVVTLERLAQALVRYCSSENARIVVAHSVSSIIATLAARQAFSSIDVILSLEGNLTPEDAYFSGTASNYDDPFAFRTAFLDRLNQMATVQPIVARYQSVVATADPQSLWELGNEAFRFSQDHVPGDELVRAAKAVYLYNPGNLPAPSIAWLSENELPGIILEDASHWPSVDQPDLLSAKLLEAISRIT